MLNEVSTPEVLSSDLPVPFNKKETLKDLLKETLVLGQSLIEKQAALFKLELKEEASHYRKVAVLLGVVVLSVWGGFLFLCFSLAVFWGEKMGWPLSLCFLVVGLLNFLIAGSLFLFFNKLKMNQEEKHFHILNSLREIFLCWTKKPSYKRT